MSFHNTAPCFLTFYRSDQSLLLFKIKIFVLNMYVSLLLDIYPCKQVQVISLAVLLLRGDL